MLYLCRAVVLSDVGLSYGQLNHRECQLAIVYHCSRIFFVQLAAAMHLQNLPKGLDLVVECGSNYMKKKIWRQPSNDINSLSEIDVYQVLCDLMSCNREGFQMFNTIILNCVHINYNQRRS